MDPRVTRLATAADCETFAANAARLGRDDLVVEARRRAVDLRAAGHAAKTDVERDCLAAIYAYEEVLRAKAGGKRRRAVRTWQSIARHGVIGAVERAVDRSDGTAGFKALQDAGLENYAFETVVLAHPMAFSEAAVERSRDRLAKFLG